MMKSNCLLLLIIIEHSGMVTLIPLGQHIGHGELKIKQMVEPCEDNLSLDCKNLMVINCIFRIFRSPAVV